MRTAAWLDDVIADGKYAARSLSRTPVFTLTAILTIALGIGVNTAVFSIVQSVLLNPLPFRDPERLVHISSTHPDLPSLQVAAPDFVDWQRTTKSFDQIAAYTFQAMNKWSIVGDGEPEVVQVVQASHNLFGMMGIRPLRGRAYTAEEEKSKAPVVLLSESLWRRRFQADPAIIGRTVRLVRSSFTVIGIIPDRQAEPRWADIWMSMAFLDPALVETRRFRALEVIGRLAPSVTIEQAQSEMTSIARARAEASRETSDKVGVSISPLSLWTTGQVRPSLLIAWAAVSLVLLLACANVAHLMLIRSVNRTREIAVRTALGASSGRIFRFLIVENSLVALLGGIAGALLAKSVMPLLLRLAPATIPAIAAHDISPAAFVFCGLAAAACAVLFALPAVLHSRQPNLNEIIRQSAGFSLTHRRSRWGSAIITVELALSFVVLTGAGLLYSSFAALLDEELGFEPQGVLVADVTVALDWNHSVEVFEQRIAPKLRAIPGVTMVSAANSAPMTLGPTETSRFTSRFRVPGESYASDMLPIAQVRWTTPDYFRTLRIPLKRGRLFNTADIGKPGYIINEALARRYFRGEDLVGRQILYGTNATTPTPIIGVVGDVRDLGLHLEPAPTLYSLGITNGMSVLVRANVAPESIAAGVREAIHSTSPEAPIRIISPLESMISASLASRSFALQLLAVFAFLAILLTAIGVYGVVSYTLAQRRNEFAIRSALGAESRHLRWLILRDFAPSATMGLAAGALLACFFGLALRTQLYKLSAADPIVLGSSAFGLVLLILVAALRPVSAATSISPAAIPRD